MMPTTGETRHGLLQKMYRNKKRTRWQRLILLFHIQSHPVVLSDVFLLFFKHVTLTLSLGTLYSLFVLFSPKKILTPDPYITHLKAL